MHWEPKACKGIFPLLLEKTAETLEEVEKKLAGLPDLELCIIVNIKPTTKDKLAEPK